MNSFGVGAGDLMLLDDEVDLDNFDVDGDTRELGRRGHADIVIMLEEERLSRDLKVREANG